MRHITLHVAGKPGDASTPQRCRRCGRVLRLQNFQPRGFFPLQATVGEEVAQGQKTLYTEPPEEIVGGVVVRCSPLR